MRLLLVLLPIFFATAASAAEFTLCSWNIHKGKKWHKVLGEIATRELSDCGVLALQEVLTGSEGSQEVKIAEVAKGTATVAGRDVIVSRLPTLRGGSIIVNAETGRQAAWADISVGSAAVRVYDLHLSYKVSKSPFITEVRSSEVLAVLDHLSDWAGPAVIAGDFNTVGWFFCCHRDAPLLDRLREAGFIEASAKGPTQWSAGKVDWIFSRGLQVEKKELGKYAGSDHRWLKTVFSLE